MTDALHPTPAATPDPSTLDPQIAELLKRDEHGLVAAVVQQHDTGDVLMVGWMDDEALRRTLGEGRVTFWSTLTSRASPSQSRRTPLTHCTWPLVSPLRQYS